MMAALSHSTGGIPGVPSAPLLGFTVGSGSHPLVRWTPCVGRGPSPAISRSAVAWSSRPRCPAPARLVVLLVTGRGKPGAAGRADRPCWSALVCRTVGSAIPGPRPPRGAPTVQRPNLAPGSVPALGVLTAGLERHFLSRRLVPAALTGCPGPRSFDLGHGPKPFPSTCWGAQEVHPPRKVVQYYFFTCNKPTAAASALFSRERFPDARSPRNRWPVTHDLRRGLTFAP